MSILSLFSSLCLPPFHTLSVGISIGGSDKGLDWQEQSSRALSRMTPATSGEAGAQAAPDGAVVALPPPRAAPIPAPRKTRAAPPRPIPAAGAERGQ